MEPEQKSNGALIGSIIVIVILVLGGLYLMKTNWKNETPAPTSESTEMPNGEVIIETEADTSVIETELENIDLESLDAEI